MAKSKNRKPKNTKKEEKEIENKKEPENQKKIKSETLIVFGVILLIVIISIFFILETSNTTNIQRSNNNSIIIDETAKINLTQCISNLGIKEKVIYVYGERCSYSQENTPFVDQLINEGFEIHKIEVQSIQFIQFYNCVNNEFDISGTPEFICITSKKMHEGPFSTKKEIEEFIKNC